MPHLTINYTQDIDTVYRFVTDPETHQEALRGAR